MQIRNCAIALAALAVPCAAQAAAYIKLGDIKGESGLATAGIEPDEIDARAAAADSSGEVWVELVALDFAPEASAEGSSGMATGRRTYQPIVIRKRIDKSSAEGAAPDDAAAAAEAAPAPAPRKFSNITLKRGVADTSGQQAGGSTTTYGPVITIKPKGDHTGGPGDIAAPGKEPTAVALLLPAVQKVREAAARRSPGSSCRLGPVGGPVPMRDDTTGGTRTILDAQVVACEPEMVVFTFSKIEW